MSDQIISCPNCATQNRVPASSTGAPVCSSCWSPLRKERSAQAPTAPVTPPPPASTGQSKSSNKGCLWAVIAVVCIGGCSLITSNDKPRKTYTAPTSPPAAAYVRPQPVQPKLTPLPSPDHGAYINDTGRENLAPFKITTSSGANYYLKLVDAYTGVTAVQIFVRGGSPLEVDVPLGSYRLKYATGTVWYGAAEYFGPDTVFSESSSRFEFTLSGNYYSGNEVTLYKVQGGNMRTNKISKENF